VDLLLEAFLHEFTAVDQVELLVHTQYGDAPVQALVGGPACWIEGPFSNPC
jgi:hypothetical protein